MYASTLKTRVGTIVDQKILKQAGVVDNSKSIKLLHPYCVFPFWYDMHSKDKTVSIDLL